MAARDDCFKMPMRRWLPFIIEDGNIEGLEWLDSSEKRYFKIPWMKKDYPGWQNCEKLVQAWADHQGRRDKPGVSSDFTTLKSNFRNAIHKCEDFDTDDEQSELNNQTGNYKVYKLLTRKEVEIKKDKKKSEYTTARKRKKNQKTFLKGKLACHDPNVDDGAIKSIEKAIMISHHPSNSASSSSTFLADAGSQVVGADSVNASPMLLSNYEHLGLAVYDKELQGLSQPAQSQCCMNVSLDAESVHLPVFDDMHCEQAMSCSSGCYAIGMSGNTYEKPTTIQCTQDLQVPNLNVNIQPLSFIQLLHSFGISQEKLPWCELNVKYNDCAVLTEMLSKSEFGYRIFYGDEDHQKTVLRLHHNTDEELADYECPVIHLPQPSNHREIFQEILDKTDLGFIFRYDPAIHAFGVKRLCQSQIFYLDPHSAPQDQTPIKLNRQEEVFIFSFEKYLHQMYQNSQRMNIKQPPSMAEPIIYMSIGSKSNLFRENASPRGLKLEIRPFALISFHEEVLSGNTSLYFSQPTPEEEMLRGMRKVAIHE